MDSGDRTLILYFVLIIKWKLSLFVPGRYLGKEVVLERAMPRLLCWKRKQNYCCRTQGTLPLFWQLDRHPAEHLWYSILTFSMGSTRKGLWSCSCPLTPPHLSAGLWEHLVLYPAVCIAPRPVTTAFICLQITEYKTNSAVALVLLDGLGIALRHLILAVRYLKENKPWIKPFLFRSLSIQWHDANGGMKGKNPLSKKTIKVWLFPKKTS